MVLFEINENTYKNVDKGKKMLSFSLIIGSKLYYRNIENAETVTFGSGKKDTVSIPNAEKAQITVKNNNGTLSVTAKPPYNSIPAVQTNKPVNLNSSGSAVIYCTMITGQSKETYALPYSGTIRGGRSKDNHICITFPFISRNHFMIRCNNGSYVIEDLGSTNGLYLNGSKINASPLRTGDVISIFTLRMKLEGGKLRFENAGSSIRLSHISNDYPGERIIHYSTTQKRLRYHRSPRTRERLPQDMIVLSNPPQLPNAAGGYGMMGSLSYLASSAFMTAMSMIGGSFSPAFLLARAAGMIPSAISMARYSKMNKKQKADMQEYERVCVEKYEAYISEQKAKISKAADIQRRIVTNENPSPSECFKILYELRKKLWERSPRDSDFLNTRIGMGYEKLCVEVKTRADINAFQIQTDEMEKMSSQIIEETRYVDKVPARVSLTENASIGIVGDRNRVINLIRNMLIEITSLHSPQDVKITGLFNDAEQERWSFVRWLPHIWDDNGQFRYIAFDEARTAALCELLDDMLKKRTRNSRSGDYGESGKNEPKLPHFVILLSNRDTIIRYPVYSILSSMPSNIGVTVIYLFDDIYMLPPDCDYIIEVSGEACAYNRNRYDERVYFTPDKSFNRVEMDSFSRRMFAVETETTSSGAAIPSSVTFLEGMGVKRVSELRVLDRWERNRRLQSMATPVGMAANRKLFYLDINYTDEAHGPHGLVAGTTGSGKSEFLQSWILSMATNFHPHDVNFVIIDYKGGGMASLMEPLPHVVGKITNIDTDIWRTLRALKAEVNRREVLFDKAGVNRLEKYRNAYLTGMTDIPLPNLIIVVDEFAELKKEEPEFMRELVSIARVGRSLGIHLVLATQKPGGVIDDQIDANSRFRVCLKVQDVSDSREMLKRPDAAQITQAGRAYIRVGHDEVFDQFQSLFSGAVYSENNDDRLLAENLVRIVDVNGQKIESAPRRTRDKNHTDELTAVTKEINHAFKQLRLQKLNCPWLPQLPDWLPLQALETEGSFDGEQWYPQKSYLRIPVGLLDLPERQLQETLYFDFSELGHMAVYGMPSSGKTMLLETLIYSAGLTYSPRDLTIYILDFSSWMLREFSAMPHIGDVIRNDEDERIINFAIKMKKEFDKRKALFLKHMVNSLSAYRETVSNNMPAILIAVDNIHPVFQEMDALAELLYILAANGSSYGIHIVFTSNMVTGIPMKFTQLIKGAAALQLPEKGDYTGVVGYLGEVRPPLSPGRALYKGVVPVSFQTAVCIDEHNDNERHTILMNKLDEMKNVWKTIRGEDNSSEKESSFDPFADGKIQYSGNGELFDLKKDYQNSSMLPLGQGSDYEPRYLPLDKEYKLLILADERKALNGYLERLEDTLASSQDNEIYIFENRGHSENRFYAQAEHCLAAGDSAVEKVIADIAAELNRRMLMKNMGGITGDAIQPTGDKRLCLIIEDLAGLNDVLPDKSRKMLWNILSKSDGLKLCVFAAATANELRDTQSDDILISAVKEIKSSLLFCDYPSEFSFFIHGFGEISVKQNKEKDKALLVTPEQAEWISV